MEVKHKEGVPLPDRDAEGEPEGDWDAEDVRHSEVVRLPLLELERLLLDENVTLTVVERVEVGHNEGATLPLRTPLGDGDKVPVAEKLFPPEELPHSVGVMVEVRQRDGEPLAVRDTLGETVGDKDAEDEWHSDDKALPLGKTVRLLLVVNVTVALPESEEEDVRLGVVEPEAQEEMDGERVALGERLALGVGRGLSVGEADTVGESEVRPEPDTVGDCDAHTVGV